MQSLSLTLTSHHRNSHLLPFPSSPSRSPTSLHLPTSPFTPPFHPQFSFSTSCSKYRPKHQATNEHRHTYPSNFVIKFTYMNMVQQSTCATGTADEHEVALDANSFHTIVQLLKLKVLHAGFPCTFGI